MSPRVVLGRENVSCVAEVVNRSLKADCTDFTRGVDVKPCFPIHFEETFKELLSKDKPKPFSYTMRPFQF